MRTLLGLICLVIGSPAQAARGGDCPSRAEQVRAVFVEITGDAQPGQQPASELPDGLREAVEAWTEARSRD